MSRVQKVKKLSGKLYENISILNDFIDDGEYSEALSQISEIYGVLGDLEQKLDDLYESYFC